MKRIYFLLFPAFLFAIMVLVPHVAFADYTHEFFDDLGSNSPTNQTFTQRLGTGLTGTPTEATVFIQQGPSKSAPVIGIRIYEYTDAYSTLNTIYYATTTNPITSDNTKTELTFSPSSFGGVWATLAGAELEFNPDNYYSFEVCNGDTCNTSYVGGFDNFSGRVYGDESVTYGANSCVGCNNLASIGFVFLTTEPDTTTRIVEQNSPGNGEITGSSNVTFDFDYYWNDTEYPGLDFAGVLITNVITGNTAIVETALTPGAGNFSESVSLMTDQQYTWQPYLGSDNGFLIYNGSAQPPWQFFTETNPYEGGGIDTGFLATSTATSSNAFAAFYQGLVNTVRTNPPFEAVFSMLTLFSALEATEPEVDLQLPYGVRDNITDPVRDGMSWLLTIVFAVYTLNRLLTFQW